MLKMKRRVEMDGCEGQGKTIDMEMGCVSEEDGWRFKTEQSLTWADSTGA